MVPVSERVCENHPEKKAHRRSLCKSCYERQLKVENPEYAKREFERNKKRRAVAKQADPEKFLKKAAEATARYRLKHPERKKTPWQTDPQKAREAVDRYREKNVEVVRARSRAWYRSHKAENLAYRLANADVIRARVNRWRAENPHKSRSAVAEYRAAKLRAMPKWADKKAIAEIYAKAAKVGMDVDHIIPLRGVLVSGLHVAENLQLLSRSENARKGNSYAC